MAIRTHTEGSEWSARRLTNSSVFRAHPCDVSHRPESSVRLLPLLPLPPTVLYSFSKRCFLTFMSEEAKANDSEEMAFQGRGPPFEQKH